MRRFVLACAPVLAGLLLDAATMNAQTCTRPVCVGPVATPEALVGQVLREARARAWRAADRSGAAPRRGGRARWAVPAAALAEGPAPRVGVLAIEGLPGPRRHGASAWLALERSDGWHACEAASRAGSRSAVRVDVEPPRAQRLFADGPPGVTLSLSFSEAWRAHGYGYATWHEHVAACGLDGESPACFGTVEVESGASESDDAGAERFTDRVEARFDGQGHVEVVAVHGQDEVTPGAPSIFDQVGRHDVRSLGCARAGR